MTAGDADGHIKALAIRRATVSAPTFQHNLCAKLEGQLFTILLNLCISGHKDIKISIAKAGELVLPQELATDNLDQHPLTNRELWLLHPGMKSRIEQLNSLVPLAIFALVKASSSEDKVQPPNIKLPDAQQDLVRDLNDQLPLLYQATLPRGQGGVDDIQGVSFGDFVTEPLIVDMCEASSADSAH